MSIPDDLVGAFDQETIDTVFSDDIDEVKIVADVLGVCHDLCHTQLIIVEDMMGDETPAITIALMIHLAVQDLESRVLNHLKMLEAIDNGK